MENEAYLLYITSDKDTYFVEYIRFEIKIHLVQSIILIKQNMLHFPVSTLLYIHAQIWIKHA